MGTVHCDENRFLSDTKNHKMDVIRDDGVNRHIRFRKPGTVCYGFDLITWPGYLCIAGDCGTYVFSRIRDMFEFFRTEDDYKKSHPEQKLFINTGYWGEKLQSIGTNAGYKEFDAPAFEERVRHHFDMHWEDLEDEEAKAKCWQEIEDYVLPAASDGEHQAYEAVYNFRCDDFHFQDFFDGGGTNTYTFHYLWCLYAIAWGIEKYDEAKLSAAA